MWRREGCKHQFCHLYRSLSCAHALRAWQANKFLGTGLEHREFILYDKDQVRLYFARSLYIFPLVVILSLFLSLAFLLVVVFPQAQAYPEFVVRFRRKDKPQPRAKIDARKVADARSKLFKGSKAQVCQTAAAYEAIFVLEVFMSCLGDALQVSRAPSYFRLESFQIDDSFMAVDPDPVQKDIREALAQFYQMAVGGTKVKSVDVVTNSVLQQNFQRMEASLLAKQGISADRCACQQPALCYQPLFTVKISHSPARVQPSEHQRDVGLSRIQGRSYQGTVREHPSGLLCFALLYIFVWLTACVSACLDHLQEQLRH